MAGRRVPRATGLDTLRVTSLVVAPMLARGVIRRRPRGVALVERLDLDRRGSRLLARLDERYGGGPLVLRGPRRRVALVLQATDVRRVLDGTPEPFAPANREKRAALAHFQPHGVLVTRGPLRGERRELNERVLRPSRPVHPCAEAITGKVREEAAALLGSAGDGYLDWPRLTAGFGRLARRTVLGDAAAGDVALSATLDRLRDRGNWSTMRSRRRASAAALARRVQAYLDRAEPGSLMAVLAAQHADPRLDATGQVPHWLFAFDAAGIAAFRTLAVLATHPGALPLAARDLSTVDHPYLRACVLESLRLWPTTLVILRDATRPTEWDGGVLPAGTAFAVPTGYLQRDPRVLPYADRFTPEVWLDGRARDNWSLVPFSAGPARCPGEQLVLLVTSTMLAALLSGHRYALASGPALRPDRPLPATLNHFRLRLAVDG